MRRIILAVLVFALVATMVAAQEADNAVGIDSICGEGALTITVSDTLPADDATQALDALLRQFVTKASDETLPLSFFAAKPPAPGVVIYVDSPDGQYLRAIGTTDIESCAPINPAMGFPIGSNTKMMTAAVIYQLSEEGLLSTSDLVSQYLPDEIALFPGAEAATIDMLLGHTSGLPDYLNSQNPETVGGRMQAGDWDVLGVAYAPQELVTQAASQPLLFAPGTDAQWAYSNTGYIMLGQIIEQVTGKTYVEAVTERIINRLGLANTLLVTDVAPAELGLATQYLASPFTIITSGWNFSQAWSAGNAVSTPEDMATFLRAYYSGALFQHPETLAAMMAPASPTYANESDNYYYMHGGYHKHGFLGHGGQTLGTESDVGYNPSTDTVIITWANASESYTGQGVYHIGQALGLTPSLDENIREWRSMQRSAGSSDVAVLALQDVVGTTFNAVVLYVSSTQASLPIPEGSSYSVTFNADGQMNIVADCNNVMATYTTGDEGIVQIELGASTRVACPEGSVADEFLNVLGTAATVTVMDTGSQFMVSITSADQSAVTFTAAN